VHFEVSAADDAVLVAFYGELFGWDLRGTPGGGYTMIDTRGDGGINGGISRSQDGEPWATFYVETDDVQATLDQVASLGGTIAMPPAEVGGRLTIARFHDPDGLLVGLMQTAAWPARGDVPAPSAGSGEPVNWFEIMGSDAARAQQFYAEVFGWAVDGSFPGYATVDTGGGRGIQGGIGGGTEARWATVYARVADADQTLSRVGKLGGSRIADPEVPALKSAARAALYGSVDDPMKTGAFRDPAGNIFGVYDYGTG